MLISLQALANRLAIAVESLLHVQLFRHCLLLSAFSKAEEGS